MSTKQDRLRRRAADSVRALTAQDLPVPAEFHSYGQKRTKNNKKRKKRTRIRPVSTAYVATDDFLQSYEWRRARMVALKAHGARCQCCGASPATGAVMNVDHIKPRKLFPSLALEQSNLQVLCHECNHGKGNWDQTDWR